MFHPAPDILIQDCFCSTPMMGNRLFDLTDYIQNPGVNIQNWFSTDPHDELQVDLQNSWTLLLTPITCLIR